MDIPTSAVPTVSVPNLPSTGQISSVGPVAQQQPITPPTSQPPQNSGGGLSDTEKQSMIAKITQAQQQYPGQDNAILQAFIKDNQTTHPDIVQKVQQYMSDSRVNRNNNLLATAVKTGSSNEYTQALDQAGIKWSDGDSFPGEPGMSTINIQGDPIAAASAILSNSDAIQNYYLNHTGKDVLTQYGIKNNTDFKNADQQTQEAVINGIKQTENGSQGGYTPTQILSSLISDNFRNNTSTTQGTALQQLEQDWDNAKTNYAEHGIPLASALKKTAGNVGTDLLGTGKSLLATVDSAGQLSQGLMNKLIPGGNGPVSTLPTNWTQPTNRNQTPSYVGGLIGQLLAGSETALGANDTGVLPQLAKGANMVKKTWPVIKGLTEAGGVVGLLKELIDLKNSVKSSANQGQ